MTVTDAVAILALTISAAALALELRRWMESGPQLRLSLMPDATMTPHDDGKERLLLTVFNGGTAPTQVTHMVAYTYETIFHRVIGRRTKTWIIPRPSAAPGLGELPGKLDVGDRWVGAAIYDDDTKTARAQGKLYVGVAAAHSDRTFLRRVPRARPKS